MKLIQNKNILITGASKGIGKDIVDELVKHKPASLILIARNLSHLTALSKEINNINSDIKTYVINIDVSNYKEIQKKLAPIIKKVKHIHGLINNAGIFSADYFEEMPISIFEQEIKVNYLGSVYFTKEIVPYMPKGSFIAFTSSVAGLLGVFGYASYCATKFAIMGFAETLKMELYEKNIQISVLCPPDTDTPGFNQDLQTQPYETQRLAKLASLISSKKVAQKMLRGIAKKKFIILCNLDSRIIYFFKRFFPNVTLWVMIRLVQFYTLVFGWFSLKSTGIF